MYDWIVYKRESKAKEKERKGQAAREGLYTIPWSRESHVSPASTITSTIASTIAAAFCQCRNITPTSVKACPQALYVRIMLMGRSYLYALPVAYYLYYTSILSIYLGTLAVPVY